MKSEKKSVSADVINESKHKGILMSIVILLAILGVFLSVGLMVSAAGSDSDQKYDFWVAQTEEEVLISINSHTEEKAGQIVNLGYHVTQSHQGDDLICKTAGEYQGAGTPLKYASTNKGFLSSYLIDNDLINIYKHERAELLSAPEDTYTVICIRLGISSEESPSTFEDGASGYIYSNPIQLNINEPILFEYGNEGTPYLVTSSLELNDEGLFFTIGAPTSSMSPISVRYSLHENNVKLCNMNPEYYPNGDFGVLRQTSSFVREENAPLDSAAYANFNIPNDTGFNISDYSSICIMFTYSNRYGDGYWYGVYGPVNLPEKTESESRQDSQKTSTLPDNWNQLTLAEKTALNPYDCPEDENSDINIDEETGQCLESSVQTPVSTPPVSNPDILDIPPSIPEDAIIQQN